MSAADVAALITAVTALVTAVGTLLSVLGHLMHHAPAAPPAQTPPAVGDGAVPR